MKVVILAGGFGTRISEESAIRPKPLVEIGGRPILWHIMKIYSAFGLNDFVICCGYKGYMIKHYFADYVFHSADVTFDLASNHMKIHNSSAEPWRVTLVDTGELTMTGGRLKRVARHIDGTFCLTYGDGVANVDMRRLIDFHRHHGAIATVTAVRQRGRFGSLSLRPGETRVQGFREKTLEDGIVINGGFFVLEPKVLDYIDGDDTPLEQGPLQRLAGEGGLVAYHHDGFWACMDTLADKHTLEELWASGEAPWRVWGRRDAEVVRHPAALAQQPAVGGKA
jgi:glucose-1-phosphate cytidylyltransferase